MFWREDTASLPNNYDAALKALHRTEARYVRDPDLGEKAHLEMQALVAQGFARKVEPQEMPGPKGDKKIRRRYAICGGGLTNSTRSVPDDGAHFRSHMFTLNLLLSLAENSVG